MYDPILLIIYILTQEYERLCLKRFVIKKSSIVFMLSFYGVVHYSFLSLPYTHTTYFM